MALIDVLVAALVLSEGGTAQLLETTLWKITIRHGQINLIIHVKSLVLKEKIHGITKSKTVQ